MPERTDRELQEQQRAVVAGGAIQVENTTAAAAVHQEPFTVGAGGDRDRFHRGCTVSTSVSGHVVVEVTTPETERTVIAVGGARGIERHVEVAVPAAERSAAGPARA
jgi:hypothetical protein